MFAKISHFVLYSAKLENYAWQIIPFFTNESILCHIHLIHAIKHFANLSDSLFVLELTIKELVSYWVTDTITTPF